MHSTPELNLFNLFKRDRSHGCVRLEHADQMAEWVLSGQGDWDAQKIADAMQNEQANNKTVGLKTPLPVVIFYLTATADEDGTIHFFNDVYGYDKSLEDVINKGMPYPSIARENQPETDARRNGLADCQASQRDSNVPLIRLLRCRICSARVPPRRSRPAAALTGHHRPLYP